MTNTIDQNEECGNRIIVDVEIVNVDDQTSSEHDEIICENDAVEEDNADVVNVKIVDAEDDVLENRTSDKERTEESDGKIAGSFVCNICNVAAKSKYELVSHKVSTHNWCVKCFSTFDSRDKLKNHLSTKHKKNNDWTQNKGEGPR